MMQPPPPKFDWGQKVRTLSALHNDGSYPERGPGELLAVEGALGEVINVGRVSETGASVYLVEFPDGLVIGCFEAELEAA